MLDISKDIFLEDRHGGDLSDAQRIYKEVTQWIDLSTGINPNPYKEFNLDISIYNNLPSPYRIEQLLFIARGYYQLKENIPLIAYQGAQGFINILPQIIEEMNNKNIQIYSPTYSEHYKSWINAGYNINLIYKTESKINPSAVTVVVNPNNPDGKIYNQDELEILHNKIQDRDGFLIIDESFMDATPDQGFNYFTEKKNVIIIRSFGKFFGLPGLRLGFAYGDTKYINKIEQLVGPWPISVSSIDIAMKAMSDIEWIKHTINQLKIRSNDLELSLKDLGIEIIGGTLFFKLIKLEDANKINHLLAKEGIWTRKFSYNNSWLRLGVPKNQFELSYLVNKMKKILR